MIHIATIHFRSPRWIDPQLEYLRRNTTEPYRVYAYLNEIDRRHYAKFDRVLDREEPIPTKLNRLAEEICAYAQPDDLLVFLHGDAFPIASWVEPVRAMVGEHRLAAVRRDENAGEPMPHPSFTATTPAFWQQVGGDWSAGPIQPDRREVTDVGVVLWRTLAERGIDWQPIRRTNTRDLHPVWFGVYGDLIYHHGAGFRRRRVSRADLGPLFGRFERIGRWRPVRRARRLLADRRSAPLSEEMFAKLSSDPQFWRELTA